MSGDGNKHHKITLILYHSLICPIFSVGDNILPGNYGMMDQVEALRWVQENIHGEAKLTRFVVC